jgi:2-dehydropantoate 2-reductase
MDEGLTVAVMGAGAVGCYYGGMLARAGHDVVLIARRNHVEAMERDGLRMQTRSFDEHVRVRASTDPAAVRGADLVLFSVKSMDTEAAGRQVREHLEPAALVLCLQNGVDNADRLRDVLGPSARLRRPSSTSPLKWLGPATCATTAGVSW